MLGIASMDVGQVQFDRRNAPSQDRQRITQRNRMKRQTGRSDHDDIRSPAFGLHQIDRYTFVVGLRKHLLNLELGDKRATALLDRAQSDSTLDLGFPFAQQGCTGA